MTHQHTEARNHFL